MDLNTKKIVSTAGTYLGLKLFRNKIDPFNRAGLGFLTCLVSVPFASAGLTSFIPLAISIGAGLQLIDVNKGGKLFINNATQPLFLLHKEKGIIKIKPGELVDFPIDGITMPEMFGVWKVIDGGYVIVNDKNGISLQKGISLVANRIRKGGFKNQNWVSKQQDKRWLDLYNKSVVGNPNLEN